MLAVLAADWGLLLFRALLALLFGVAVLAWPGLTPIAFAALFGVYALPDSGAALMRAFHARGLPGFGSFLFEALVRLGAFVVVLAMPGRVALALPAFFAAWAGLSGIGQIAEAVALRREMAGEWPLPTAGGLSLLVSLFLMARPGIGTTELAWLIGPYSVLFSCALVVLAVRLRQLAREMARI
jgi:uncharacterized membrane protein HdeD (DUF308 family)